MSGLNHGKFYKPMLVVVGLLWSALMVFIGGASQAASLRAHETEGHPVVAAQLQAIEAQLDDIKTDVREIRRAVGGGD